MDVHMRHETKKRVPTAKVVKTPVSTALPPTTHLSPEMRVLYLNCNRPP